MRISDLDRQDACFFGWVVIPAWEQGIPDKNHLLYFNAKRVPEFSNPVGFVDAGFGDINGCRSTQTHGKLGDKLNRGALSSSSVW